MKNVVIIEDESSAAELLKSYILRYSESIGEDMKVVWYADAISFLENYKGNFDIVFADIELPVMDGMDMAKRLRAMDEKAVIVFVTQMAQYAVKGYEVNALDFILKPVSYTEFSLKMMRILNYLKEHENIKLTLKTVDGVVCVSLGDLKYVEVLNHKLTYHTKTGNFTEYGQLMQLEKKLPSGAFARCSNSYLVNLKYVTSVKGQTLFIGEEELPISHGKKKEFIKCLAAYFGGFTICMN